jgi:hypothetical protein
MCGLMLTLLLGFATPSGPLPVRPTCGAARYSPALLDRLIVVASAAASRTASTPSARRRSRCRQRDLVYTVPIVTYALFRYLYLLGNGHAAEDPSGLFVGDRHLQAAALAWLVAVVWILR